MTSKINFDGNVTAIIPVLEYVDLIDLILHGFYKDRQIVVYNVKTDKVILKLLDTFIVKNKNTKTQESFSYLNNAITPYVDMINKGVLSIYNLDGYEIINRENLKEICEGYNTKSLSMQLVSHFINVYLERNCLWCNSKMDFHTYLLNQLDINQLSISPESLKTANSKISETSEFVRIEELCKLSLTKLQEQLDNVFGCDKWGMYSVKIRFGQCFIQRSDFRIAQWEITHGQKYRK